MSPVGIEFFNECRMLAVNVEILTSASQGQGIVFAWRLHSPVDSMVTIDGVKIKDEW